MRGERGQGTDNSMEQEQEDDEGIPRRQEDEASDAVYDGAR